ncbi:peptidoglycan-binding domain-containing protein [Kitasatospora sp. CM 4170]|uniref:Peptidoglycan-binding domain-containing protein n=1 Tax=Kitasatospora aburaviensis TaxID=67265 RepID=A0ABW1F6W5_9ACTN|nr:peptidoglycan-binding domain-containing protein [Kitasatospora sp. CM 4170]WNM49249.1 peptidoglycan-binding domain-containing protein [Kitasatospora sp. CM 4170]
MRKPWALRAATLTAGAGAALALTVGSAGAATVPTTVKLGDTGPAVTCIQQGLNLEISAGLTVSGTYDQATANAVAKFQSLRLFGQNPLPQTGVFDSATGGRLYQVTFFDAGVVNPGDYDGRVKWLFTDKCPEKIPH